MNLTFFSFLFLLFISGQIVTVLCSMLGILYWTRQSLMPWRTLTLLEFLAEQFRAHCWRKLFTWKYKVELFSCIEKASIPSWIKLSKCCSRLVLSNIKKYISNHIRLNLEPCDLTEFSTSLECFGAVKFRPNFSSNHSASLAFHLDCSNPGGAASIDYSFCLSLTPFLSLVCAKQPIKSGREVWGVLNVMPKIS